MDRDWMWFIFCLTLLRPLIAVLAGKLLESMSDELYGYDAVVEVGKNLSKKL